MLEISGLLKQALSVVQFQCWRQGFMMLHPVVVVYGCALSLSLSRSRGRLERISHLSEKQESAREKQTHQMNARSSPVNVQGCPPKVYLHHETSFFFCCLESRKWNVKCLVLNWHENLKWKAGSRWTILRFSCKGDNIVEVIPVQHRSAKTMKNTLLCIPGQ